jgi:exosortase
LKFLVFWGLSLPLFHTPLQALAALSLRDYRYSHIVCVPAIAVALAWFERRTIFTEPRLCPRLGLPALVAALLLYAAVGALPALHDTAPVLAIVFVWMAGFLLCYGPRCLKAAAFAWFVLFLIVPLPPGLLERAIALLQRGSAELAYFLFRLAGVPVFRQDFLFSLPRANIEVAAECSSIRSATALFITSLLAGRAFLRSGGERLVLVLFTPAFAICTNAVRIVVLASLASYVDPSYLYGNLHQRGGALFSLLSVVMLVTAIAVLQRLELRSRAAGQTPRP